ncbi:hypothetical protein A8B82_11755 [Sulfitobacter sp. EhC04]|uniref:hypothetical protein n=1 Tax=Sulfitobacter sp. EhC04 TaxID=1849168 RepID=UPI0007F3AE5A|nr:hypothetical protein [Sulfitobacter sp. EhC04]OAN77877.1 hypothetical protein A8B82_11755 [Sulfitobacter sp. EhC04]
MQPNYPNFSYTVIFLALCASPLTAQVTTHPDDTVIEGDLKVQVPSGGNPNEGSLYVEADSVIDGSLCLGNTCSEGETFPNDVTLRLKYTQHAIEFVDTSSGSSPNRDWTLRINDPQSVASGGIDKFAVEDDTAGTTPFTIAGGAPSNAFWLATSGRLGLGTMLPASELHIVGPSFPSIRLQQSTATGNPASTWRMQGNHNEFTIIQSAATFGIAANAPYGSFRISNNGNIGLGTVAPQEKLHIVSATNGVDAFALFEATGADADSAFRLKQNGVTPSTWEFRNQQDSGRLNIGLAGGNTPLKIDNAANNNLLRLGRNGLPGEVNITGTLVVNNTAMNVPDYVFADDYALRPLAEVQAFIDANSHLPEVPSEADIRANGVDMTQMQMVQLKKIEELTLYTLEQATQINSQSAIIADLTARLAQVEGKLAD